MPTLPDTHTPHTHQDASPKTTLLVVVLQLLSMAAEFGLHLELNMGWEGDGEREGGMERGRDE